MRLTAAFNLNLLRRINRELDADFDLNGFTHRAVYGPAEGRIEMRLVSRHAQRVQVDKAPFAFAAGEFIVTEHSHKYTRDGITRLAARAGWTAGPFWTDEEKLFGVGFFSS